MPYLSQEIATELGPMEAIVYNDALVYLNFKDNSKREKMLQQIIGDEEVVDQKHFIHSDLDKEIQEYFEGDLEEFSIPLEFTGSPFQKEVWKSNTSKKTCEV